MLRRDWHDAVQTTEWRELIDDKHVLVAEVYIKLANPKPRGKERPVCRLGQIAKVPIDATPELKERTLITTRNLFIGGFDRIYESQHEFEITEKTKPV